MSRAYSILTATAAAIVVSSPARAQARNTAASCPSGPTFVTCLRQGEAAIFRKHPGVALRREDDLVLKLRTGDSVIVRDTNSTREGAYESHYHLVAIDDSSGYFVVTMDAYENQGSVVISQRTGWRRFIDFAAPLFQPSRRYAAALIPADAAYWEPTIDIFRVTPDSLIAELHLATPRAFVRGDTVWNPIKARWDADRLVVETREMLRGDRSRDWPGRMALAKLNGRWQLLGK